MYTTQSKNNKTTSRTSNGASKKPAKLPVFGDNTELQDFLQRNLQDSLKQLI
jgi:hypothetical protein